MPLHNTRLIVSEEAVVVATGRLGLIVDIPITEGDPHQVTVFDYLTRSYATLDHTALMRRPPQPGDRIFIFTNSAGNDRGAKGTILEVRPFPGVALLAEVDEHVRPVYDDDVWGYDFQLPWLERQRQLMRSMAMLRPADELQQNYIKQAYDR
jgi:hypothetical protein